MGSLDATTSTISETYQILSQALEDAQQAYIKSHVLSKKSHEEACLYMPGGNTRTVLYTLPFPFTIAFASGCHIQTIDGDDYVDFLGEYTAGIYGHNHPVIRAAVEQALAGGWNYGGHSKVEQDLARVVCTRFPSIEMVRFVNSGTEANMMALATSLAYARLQNFREKTKVLVFAKGYHGSTISGRVTSAKPSINLPHDFVTGTYNDATSTIELVSSLPEDSLAAILVEPMLGSGGCYAASSQFIQTLRQLATQHKALLIFDEVMTSRLAYNGFHATFGVTPDLVTLGKYIGGGMTFGAFGGRKDIMSLYDPRQGQLEHPGTFNNNVFTMHAGVAGCNLLTPERIITLNGLGDRMKHAVEEVLERYEVLKDGTIPVAPPTDEAMHSRDHPCRPPKMFLKGVGSLMCMQFAGPDREQLQGLFYLHMLAQNIYLAQRGFIALSIEITQTHVGQFVAAVDAFCKQWATALRW